MEAISSDDRRNQVLMREWAQEVSKPAVGVVEGGSAALAGSPPREGTPALAASKGLPKGRAALIATGEQQARHERGCLNMWGHNRGNGCLRGGRPGGASARAAAGRLGAARDYGVSSMAPAGTLLSCPCVRASLDSNFSCIYPFNLTEKQIVKSKYLNLDVYLSFVSNQSIFAYIPRN